jgi:tetratricopeptide (TPR) repeat protein
MNILYNQFEVFPDTSKVIKQLSHHEISESINESNELIYRYPNNAKLRFDLGEAFAMYLLLNPEILVAEDDVKSNIYQKVYNQAEKSYIDALKLNPSYAEARRALGGLYHLKGENSKSVEQYSIAIDNGMSGTDIYRKMAIGHFRLGNHKLAKHYYELIPDKDKVIHKTEKPQKITILDMFKIGHDLAIALEADLEWHVTNGMLYDLSSGNNEIAKLWIKTGLALALNKFTLQNFDNKSSFIDFANSSPENIIADTNKFFEDRKYGIEIMSIKLREL